MASEEEVPWPLFALNYLSDGQQWSYLVFIHVGLEPKLSS